MVIWRDHRFQSNGVLDFHTFIGTYKWRIELEHCFVGNPGFGNSPKAWGRKIPKHYLVALFCDILVVKNVRANNIPFGYETLDHKRISVLRYLVYLMQTFLSADSAVLLLQTARQRKMTLIRVNDFLRVLRVIQKLWKRIFNKTDLCLLSPIDAMAVHLQLIRKLRVFCAENTAY